MSNSVTCPHCQTVLAAKTAIPPVQMLKCMKCAQVFRAGASVTAPSPPAVTPPAPAPKEPPAVTPPKVESPVTAARPSRPTASGPSAQKVKKPDADELILDNPLDLTSPTRAAASTKSRDDEDEYRVRPKAKDGIIKPRTSSRGGWGMGKPATAIIAALASLFAFCGIGSVIVAVRVFSNFHTIEAMVKHELEEEARRSIPIIGDHIDDAGAKPIAIKLSAKRTYRDAAQLTQADAKIASIPYKLYTLLLKPGFIYRVVMTSKKCEPCLRLVQEDGTVEEMASHFEGTNDAQLNLATMVDKQYRIHATVVTPVKGAPPFSYTLEVSAENPEWEFNRKVPRYPPVDGKL